VSRPTSPYEDTSTRLTIASMTAGLAAVLILVTSAMEILQGMAAIADGDFYAAGTEYLYKFNMDVWGTVYLVLGGLGVVAGIGILIRASWGPVVGMLLAGMTIIGNFALLPRNPAWSIIVIGFSVAALWAFCALSKPVPAVERATGADQGW